jgi:prolyl-tRNA synthetase
MKFSEFYAPTKRDAAKQDSVNAYLLAKAGYISQVAAGVYALLPLAVRSLQKIEQVVREEMNSIGGNEVVFSALQPKSTWEKSGRWDDENFRQIVYIDQDADMTFGATHEEPMSIAVKEKVQSYRDLPVILYQFQTKFRKELRAKSGLLRGREFRMKDLYSFHFDNDSHHEFYESAAAAYLRVFKRLGLDAYRVKASGGVFSKEYSDEFQVICPTGEDEILVNHKTKTGFNKEVEADISVAEKDKLERVKAIEVGNIFHLGSKYSDAFDLKYLNKDGVRKSIVMGSYGIGITRLLGTIAELFHDQNGLVLPKQVAPFQVYLIDLTNSKDGVGLYNTLTKAGFEVLFDDRELPAGAKFVEADLIGIPVRLVLSPKTKAENAVELKERSSDTSTVVSLKEVSKALEKIFS